MDIKISPSIMCCKVEEYKPYLELFEKVQLDSVHFDIMDGAYVKNVMLGTPIYKDIKRLSKLPVDVHIMSYRPEEYMETVRGIFPQAYPGRDGKSAELNFEEE